MSNEDDSGEKTDSQELQSLVDDSVSSALLERIRENDMTEAELAKIINSQTQEPDSPKFEDQRVMKNIVSTDLSERDTVDLTSVEPQESTGDDSE